MKGSNVGAAGRAGLVGWGLALVIIVTVVPSGSAQAKNEFGGVFSTPTIDGDTLYVGTRTECVYAFDLREGICPTGSTCDSEGGIDCLLDTNGSPSGSRCEYLDGSGSPCSHDAQLNCILAQCPDGSVCPDTGKCADSTPCFTRVKWAYDTDKEVLNNPTVDWCVPPDAFATYPGQEHLQPRSVGTECVFIGSTDQHFYALQAHSTEPNGSCVWRESLDGTVESQAVIDGDRIFVGSMDGAGGSGGLFALRRYPGFADPQNPPAACSPNPLSAGCVAGLTPREPGWPLREIGMGQGQGLGPIRHDPTLPVDGNGVRIPNRVVVGTVGGHTGLHLVDTQGVQVLGSIYDAGAGETGFRVSAVADDTGGIFTSGGLGENDDRNKIVGVRVSDDHYALEALRVPSGGGGDVDWLVDRTAIADLQVHKSRPALSTDYTTLYSGTRSDSAPDGKKVFAFHTGSDPIPVKWELTAANIDQLEQLCTAETCGGGTMNPSGFVASGVAAKTACQGEIPGLEISPSSCAGCQDGQVETFFIGNKTKLFLAVADCETEPVIKWVQKLDHTKIRSTPAVSGNRVYIGDDSDTDSQSTFYALDIETGTRVWQHQITEEKAAGRCGVPTQTGTNCYLNPVPVVLDLSGGAIDATGCTTASSVLLAAGWWVAEGVAGANQFGETSAWENETYPGLPLVDYNPGLTCPYGCLAGVTLGDGDNDITVGLTDANGRRGKTRVTVHKAATCP